MKKHLITGITGQDGIFLTSEILKHEKDSKIIGVSRNKNTDAFYKNLSKLNINNIENIEIININLNNSDAVIGSLGSIKPDFVYNLSGPSSPYESIKNPEKYVQIEYIFNNLIDGLIENKNLCTFFQASSSEMFLGNENEKLDEISTFGPKTPYAKAKLMNHKKVLELKEKYGWNIYSGIMFNHESEYRKENYLFMKIIDSAIKIREDSNTKLIIGSLSYKRDWSFAGDITSAIYKIVNFGKDNSYVVGSGEENSIKDIVSIVFDYFKIDIDSHIVIDESLLRKDDSSYIVSNPSKIYSELNWKTKLSFEDLVLRCIKSRI